MHRTPDGFLHHSGVLIPVNDALHHVHEPVAIQHPTGVIRPHCLAEIAKLLRRFPTSGAVHIQPQRHLEFYVGADAVPEFNRALTVLRTSLCATLPDNAVAASNELEFHFAKGILSMRQMYALAALAHLENAEAIRFGTEIDTAHLVGVPSERHAAIVLELSDFGFTF